MTLKYITNYVVLYALNIIIAVGEEVTITIFFYKWKICFFNINLFILIGG